MLPRTLKNWAIWIDGLSFIGRASSITLPALKIKTSEYRLSGSDAPVEVDQGLETLTCKIVLPEIDPHVYRIFGLHGTIGQITARGALQRENELAVPAVAVMHGNFKSVEQDEWKVGEESNTTLEAVLRRYSLTIAGEPCINIDVENNIRLISGFDQNASIRTALGI